MSERAADIGVVVIGRNEGARLVLCLDSVMGRGHAVVYVDSGSGDGSAQVASRRGAIVVELDPSLPFTAARARNAGFDRLMEIDSSLTSVQFVDGDSALVEGWLGHAVAAMSAIPDCIAVCGHCRERNPEASIYNRLCALEWKGAPGVIDFAGGIVMLRADAFRRVGGFDVWLIAGEDPELCSRLRAAGGKIVKLDHDMCLHDAGMTRWTQWWRRSVRSGHAYAESRTWPASSGGSVWRRERRSNWLWGAVVPCLTIALLPLIGMSSLVLLVAYPALAVKTAIGRRKRLGESWHDAGLYGIFCVLGKVPAALGQARFWMNRSRGVTTRLIEHKSAVAEASLHTTRIVTEVEQHVPPDTARDAGSRGPCTD